LVNEKDFVTLHLLQMVYDMLTSLNKGETNTCLTYYNVCLHFHIDLKTYKIEMHFP